MEKIVNLDICNPPVHSSLCGDRNRTVFKSLILEVKFLIKFPISLTFWIASVDIKRPLGALVDIKRPLGEWIRLSENLLIRGYILFYL